MRFNLSALAVRERSVTLFFILLLAAAGVYAFFMLGRAEDPNFTIKTLTVTTAWPGATAREMQDLVAEPLEKRLQELSWYDRVETSTRPGYAYMTLTLKDSTPPSAVQEEFYQARKKLGDEARNLPPGVLGPFVNDEYSDVSFALYALKAKGMPMRELARHAEVMLTAWSVTFSSAIPRGSVRAMAADLSSNALPSARPFQPSCMTAASMMVGSP